MGVRVGFVVVSHSRALGEAVRSLAAEMVPGDRVRIELAAGLDATTFGTDATAISDAVSHVAGAVEQVVVLMDLGSAVLSAELALELVDEDVRGRVLLCPAALVEGLVIAVVAAAGGADAARVVAEAAGALDAKNQQLAPGDAQSAGVDVEDADASADFAVTLPHGLHARPVALLVSALSGLDAQVRLVDLTTGAGPAAANSPTAVAGLGAAHGHQVRVLADGHDADEAVARVLDLAARDFDGASDRRPHPVPEQHARGPEPGTVAEGVAHVWRPPDPRVVDPHGDAEVQEAALARARTRVRQHISDVRERARAVAGDDAAAIFDAHLSLLDDSHLLHQAHDQIAGGAATAWERAVAGVEQQLAAVPDPYLQARAADVRAVGDQVLRALGDEPEPVPDLDGILVADDLTPAQLVAVGAGVVGVLLAGGSPVSHAAMLARQRGLPWVAEAGSQVLDLDGQSVRLTDGCWARVES
ncbi:MAG: dihydroxyacetone kinase phosphoryl donor subunit DhaM [Actinomycetota bacterium]|nr:dihydroxyacetone kinase phosphoryl donor subunit DhaM [Actinomycetota bacterium]